MNFSRWDQADKERAYRGIVLLICICVAFFASWKLLDSPRPWFDEGIYLQAGRVLAQKGSFGVPLAPNEFAPLTFITVGYPLLAPLAAAFGLFGVSLETARWFMLGVMLLALVAGSYLMRSLYGRRVGVWSAVLLATFSPFYGDGKNVMGEVPGLLYLFLTCLVLLKIEKRKSSWKDWIGLGTLAALTCATKPSFLVLIPALLAGVWMIWKKQKTALKELVTGLMAFLFGMFVWWKTQFGTDASGVLGHYANPYGLTDLKTTIIHNIAGFFTNATPLYLFVLFIGVGFFLWKRRKHLSAVEVVLAIFVGLTVVAYFRTAGWYRYFFLAHAILVLWIPAAALCLKQKGKWVLALLLCAQLFMLGRDPFPLFGEHWREARSSIQALPKGTQVLYANAPEFAFFANDLDYTQDLHITDQVRLVPSSEDLEHFDVLFIGSNSNIKAPDDFYLDKNFGDVSVYKKASMARLDADVK